MKTHLLLPSLLAVAYGLAVRSLPAAETRAVTLNDCIQMALVHNLDIRIQRYLPLFAVQDLRFAEAGYEPLFSVSGRHDDSLSGGGIDEFSRPISPTKTETDTFRADLGGTAPVTGLRYTVSAIAAERYGTSTPSSNNPTGGFDQASGSVSITLTQPLLKGFLNDNIRYAIAVARNRLKYNDTALRAQIIITITAVEQAYFDLIFARESVKVQEKALQLADRLLTENKRRVEVGALAPLDEKQAESQVAVRRADLLSAQRVLDAAQNALRKLVTDSYSTVHGTDFEPSEALLPVAESFDVQESWRKGLSLRPDLQQSRLDLDQDQIDQRFFRNQVLPQLDLIGSYGHGASGVNTIEFSDALGDFRSGRNPFYFYGAQLSIPLGNSAARSRYKRSKLAVEQGQLILRKLEQDIMVQIDDAIKLARTNFERVDATRQARLYSEAALEAEEKKLENGKSTSFVVLQLQRDLTSARSEEIRALSDYNKSLSQIAQNEGSTLERRKIDVQVK